VIEAIVLAAGLGTRMGQAKPLLLVDGEPALARVLRRIRDAGLAHPVVVLGAPSAQRIDEAVDLTDATIVLNESPEAGMSGSLRLGLAAVSGEAAGALVFHADMPFVATETVQAVVRAADCGADIAAPRFRGHRGFPVFFRQARFPELRESLVGDTGGRAYLETHRDELVCVDVDDPGCVHDIDRPGDLKAWKEERT